MELPIDAIRPRLFELLKSGRKSFAIAAPTGSGKSTRLPAMLAESGFANGRVIVMQPRRIAARMLAKTLARMSGSDDAAGWHVRFDKHYGPNTKIVFVTEGILARMILADPALKGVGAIVLDEFHERNIYADISLALAMRCRRELRPDLILAVCSATMDSAALANHIGAEVLECAGRPFPIEILHAPPRRDEAVWDCAAREFERLARNSDSGNFLIFMPGAYEISRTIGRLSGNPAARGFEIFALHGDLPPEHQDKILAPSRARKIIVSTNVAETSLTIDGVRFVIDSGLAKVARFDAARAVNTLLVERISLASATQRAGRAGRTAPGVASRLWRKSDEQYFERSTPPEIRRLDPSQILLWLKSAGLEFGNLDLFEAPPAESLARAEKSLRDLGVLDASAKITPTGRKMAAFPAQPRLARLIMEAARRDCLADACLLSAALDGGKIKLPLDDAFARARRDALTADASGEAEELISLCCVARENSFREDFCREYAIHSSNARRACAAAAELARIAKNSIGHASPNSAEAGEPRGERLAKCVLAAFSDRLCARLNAGTFACRVVGGKRGEIRKQSRPWASDLFVALELGEQETANGASILASMTVPVRIDQIRELFPGEFSDSTSTFFDESQKRVVCKRIVSFRDLPLLEESGGAPDPAACAKIFCGEILAGRIRLKNFDDDAKYFIDRVNFAAECAPDSGIKPIDDRALAEIFEQMCYGLASHSDVKNADAHRALRDWLSPHQLGMLDFLAPEFAKIPNRRRPVRIRYELPSKRAVISSMFKDFYDFDPSGIRICNGAIQPTFEILAPNSRPIQTTQNLREFFQTSWVDIKKQLRARYPKHFKDEPRR